MKKKRTATDEAIDREIIAKGREGALRDFDESKALHVPAKKSEHKLISIRIPMTMMNELRDLAIKRGDVGYQQLIKIFIADGLLKSQIEYAKLLENKSSNESVKVSIPKDKLTAFCRRHHVRKLSIFGSVLRNDFHPGSDVDVLVEFKSGRTPGLIRLAGMEIELTELLGRKADLRTPAELSPYFRDEVLESSKMQYDDAA